MVITACSFIAIFSSFFILLALSWKPFKWLWLKPKKLEKLLRAQGFKGNPYRLLVGDVKDISTLLKAAHSKPIGIFDDIVPRIIPELLDLYKKHGENYYIWFGPEPAVVIQDFDFIRHASQDINRFHKPEATQFTRFLTPGLVSYNGDKWSKHRRLLDPAFHGEKLKHMFPSFITCANEMLRKWEEIVAPKGSFEMDVWPNLQSLTSDVISRTAFGSNYEEGSRTFELLREQAEHCIKALWSMFIPGWRFLPTKRNRRIKEIANDVDDSIRQIVNLRMDAVAEGKPYGDDLLGILLQSNSQEIIRHGNKNFGGMTIEEVIEECKLFYVAGQESTSVMLVWTMVLLGKYQDWQARARDEVFQMFGNNEPHLDGLNRLKIVTMILHEVLRLYPPAPVNGRKTSEEETKLGKFSLPAGINVVMPTILVHHDTEIWGDDAKEFKPERFSQGVVHATKGKAAFLPFGWGPRMCLGQSFAMLEAKVMLVMILQRFSFELSPSYSHTPISLLTLKPEHGAHLILHKL